MATINYPKLVELYEKKSPGEATAMLKAAFKAKDMKPRDFDLGKLFCECFGWNEFVDCRNNGRMVHDVFEAGGAVSMTSFIQISGQLVYSAIMDAYENEDFMFTKIIPEKQSQFIQQEKVAGITQIGDQALVVAEGQPYPLSGVSETYIQWPEALKRGQTVALTREVIFSDRTGVLLDRANQVGYSMGLNREKRAVDCAIDENAGAVSTPLGHRYNWRGTYISTFNDNTGTHTWDNLSATTTLVDFTSVDACEQLLNNMLDPDTNEPIVAEYNTLYCTKQLEKTALRILNATEIVVATPGFATTGNPVQTGVSNPYAGKFQVVTSRQLYARIGTKTSWFFGNPSRAMICKIIFPMEVREAPANSMMEFTNDIVRQFRGGEMDAYVWVEPRYVVKATV